MRRKRIIQGHPLQGVDTAGPFARLRLTDQQWKKVVVLAGIPAAENEARRDIEIALGLYREFQMTDQERIPAAVIRKRFRAIADSASNLYDDLSALVRDQQAYEAIAGIRVDPTFRQILETLMRLPKRCTIAAHRVEGGKRGPQADNIYWLIGNLDGIRKQWAGKRITRSYKDEDSRNYIKYLCSIADPAIGDGTIDNAMKKRIGAVG
jgi:hypothetical protein